MKQLVRMAWRNIWRNKRRTLITVASVFLAIFLALIMRAMQLGTYQKMTQDVVEKYTGYIQVHKSGYWSDKTIENTVIDDRTLTNTLMNTPKVESIIRRLESFALASGTAKTKGALVIGTEPEADDNMTHLSERVQEGEYFTKDDSTVLVAAKLAEYLDVKLGDTLVLLGQGYHGVSAAGKYEIGGILHFASPELNSQVVYMPLKQAQFLYSAYDRVSSFVLNVKNINSVSSIQQQLSQKLDMEKYEIMAWDEMLVELVQQIATDNIGGIIMLGILYLIVGFGIFGTILMMTTERKREFGVLNAIGMTKKKMIVMVCWETLFIAFLGIILGIVAATPIQYYFSQNPIKLTGEAAQMMEMFGVDPVIPFLVDVDLWVTHTSIVLIATLISMCLPLVSISRMRSVVAMKG